jgi:hypothetical protein
VSREFDKESGTAANCLNLARFLIEGGEKVIRTSLILTLVPIPLISPCDSEGKRHAVPEEVAMAIRLMSPPLVGAKRRWFLALSHS